MGHPQILASVSSKSKKVKSASSVPDAKRSGCSSSPAHAAWLTSCTALKTVQKQQGREENWSMSVILVMTSNCLGLKEIPSNAREHPQGQGWILLSNNQGTAIQMLWMSLSLHSFCTDVFFGWEVCDCSEYPSSTEDERNRWKAPSVSTP